MTATGWTLVGDAGMHMDPWSGRGIDMAAAHASILADELMPTLHGHADLLDALARYRRRRDEHGLDKWCETVAKADDLTQLTGQDESESAPPPRRRVATVSGKNAEVVRTRADTRGTAASDAPVFGTVP